MNKEILLAAISHHKPVLIEETEYAAAVLVLIVLNENDQFSLVLTQRSSFLSHYAGDYCFPGGLREPIDKNFIATAMREVEEEIGISKQLYTILGQLDDFHDRRGNLVRSFVAMISQADFEKNFEITRDEIESIYHFPLSDLIHIKQDPDLELITKRHPSYSYKRDKIIIWGLTASILVHFGNILYGTHKEVGKYASR